MDMWCFNGYTVPRGGLSVFLGEGCEEAGKAYKSYN
jgi:hypothetical protein